MVVTTVLRKTGEPELRARPAPPLTEQQPVRPDVAATAPSDPRGTGPRIGRRRLLAFLGIGSAAAAGAVGAASLLDAGPGEAEAAGPTPLVTGTLHFTGADLRASTGASPGELPADRAAPTISGRLIEADGSDLGSFRSTPLHSGGAALHTFELADGTILGMGSGPLSEAAFAIVGGTGAYSGATGAYVARINPKGTGGDGSGEFTVNLRPRS